MSPGPGTSAAALPAMLDYTTITEVEGMRAGYARGECGEFDYVEDLRDFEAGLRAIGIEPRRLGYGAALVEHLLRNRPPLLWNLNSGLIGESREAQVPSLCEMLSIPVVGPGAWNAAITQDKTVCCVWLQHKIPELSAPRAVHVTSREELRAAASHLAFPATYIVKANNEDSSRGLDEDCLASCLRSLVDQAEKLLREWGTVRIEEFIPGVDISANLACEPDGALLALEPAAVTTARGIHDETSRIAHAFDRQLLKDLDADLAARVKRLAVAIGVACRFREYARLDLRWAPETGRLYFLEANITPSFNLDGDYVWCAQATGLDFPSLLRNIVASAWRRALAPPGAVSVPARIRGGNALW